MADPAWLDRPLPDELEQALRSNPRAPWAIVYPVDFSIVDAATLEHLPPRMRGLAEDIQREQITSGSVRYTIIDETLGPLGAVRLRKVGDEQTEVSIEPPPQPGRRPPTDEERAMIKELTDIDTRRQAISENDRRRRAEQVTHHRWRQATQAAIIQGFIERFESEREWLDQSDEGGHPIPSPSVPHFYFEEDTWLWEQVNLKGRPLREAWPEWAQKVRARPANRARKINDTDEALYDSAKKIVRKGRKGKNRENP